MFVFGFNIEWPLFKLSASMLNGSFTKGRDLDCDLFSVSGTECDPS